MLIARSKAPQVLVNRGALEGGGVTENSGPREPQRCSFPRTPPFRSSSEIPSISIWPLCGDRRVKMVHRSSPEDVSSGKRVLGWSHCRIVAQPRAEPLAVRDASLASNRPRHKALWQAAPTEGIAPLWRCVDVWATQAGGDVQMQQHCPPKRGTQTAFAHRSLLPMLITRACQPPSRPTPLLHPPTAHAKGTKDMA
jgi:hypothetical protein